MADVNALLVQSFNEAGFYEALERAAQSKSQKAFATPGADRDFFAPIKISRSTTTNYGKFPLANTVVVIDSVEAFSEKTYDGSFVRNCPPEDWNPDTDEKCSTQYVQYLKLHSHRITFSFKYKYQDTKGTHTASYKLVVNPEKNVVKDGIDLLCPTQDPCQNYGGLTEEMAVLGIREYLGLDNTQLVAEITEAKEEAAILQEEAAREAAKLKEEAYQKSRPTLFGQ